MLQITDSERLLADNKKLALSLYRRNHMDPLNYIQVMLLRKHRNTKEHEEEANPLLRTIHAIAAKKY